jgi:hypothetical protein
MRVNCRVLRKFTINLTIDKHDAIGVVYRITGGDQPFNLMVISANLGRGYDMVEFKRNVMRVLNTMDDVTYCVLLLQEVDEADKAPERQIIKNSMEPGTTCVMWWTREPIAVSPGVPVRRERKTMTMDQGSEIGAPKGTGPRRFIVSCIGTIHGVKIGFWCQHPHRVDPDWTPKQKQVVINARERGVRVTKAEVHALTTLCDIVTGGGDMNDPNYPKTHPKEWTAHERGLDTIRCVVA